MIKGQLLVLSGPFLDLFVNVSSLFGWEMIMNQSKYPIIMIAIFDALLMMVGSCLSTIDTDIKEKVENSRKLVLIRSTFATSYRVANELYLSNIADMLSGMNPILSNIESNLIFFESKKTPENTIADMRDRVRTNDQLLVELTNKLNVLIPIHYHIVIKCL